MFNLALTPTEQFMLEAIKHRDFLDTALLTSLYEKLGDQHLYETCLHNGIASIAADALSLCSGLDLPSHWRTIYSQVDKRISAYMRELDKAASLLDGHEIPVIALKNSGIARAIYQYPGASPMGDLDVLVRKTDFRKAHNLLIANGYTFKFRSPLEEEDLDLAEKGGGAEYSVVLPSGEHLWFELQWRPIAGRWIQPHQEPGSDLLVERALEIPESKVKILCPEDNLLQVALHTAKHTFVRSPGFRLHTDVDRIARSTSIDWDSFVDSVVLLNVKTAVFFSLALARDLLDTPIPDNVLYSLRPSNWKVRYMVNSLQKVGLFDPEGRKWNRLGYIIFVSLLYDDLRSFISGLFPSASVMQERYGAPKGIRLWYYYLKRLLALFLFRTLNK